MEDYEIVARLKNLRRRYEGCNEDLNRNLDEMAKKVEAFDLANAGLSGRITDLQEELKEIKAEIYTCAVLLGNDEKTQN